MKNTTRSRLFALTIGSALLASVSPALAHGGAGGPQLHVGTAYDSCYMDLHPELTQGQFRTFAREASQVARFNQFGAPQGLGAGTLSIGVADAWTKIDDTKGAWNNTFSHPKADHWLGDVQSFPRLVVRYGLTDRVDVGIWGAINPQSNYGFVGLEAKLTLLEAEVASLPVYVAIRPNVTTLLGPDEVWLGNASVDATAGFTFAGLSPYVGVGSTVAVAVERSRDVTLDPVVTVTPSAITGLSYRVWHLNVAAEATFSTVNTFGLVIAGTL